MSENTEGLRVPPHAEEAEQGVLGSILLSPEIGIAKAVGRGLRVESFYDRRYQALFAALLEMSDAKFGMDAITIGSWLKDHNELDRVGGYDELVALQGAAGIAAHLVHYADIVVEKKRLRDVLALADFAADGVYQPEGSSYDLMGEVSSRLVKLMEVRTGETNQQILDRWYDRMVAIKNGEITNGLPLPWPALDDLMCGLEPGLIIVGAEKSGGKTTFELNICDHLARDGCPIARAGLDMSAEQLLCRSVVREARVSLPRMKRGWARWNQLETVRECKDLVATWPYHIVQARTLDAICQEARLMKLKYGIQLLTVDFIQLVTTGDPRMDGNMNMLMGTVTLKLKALAFELDIPVVLLSQFSRGVARPNEKRRRPTLTDLRDSGNIEQNATQVLLISKALPEDFPLRGGHGLDKDEPIELPEEADRGYYRPVVFDLAKNQNGETGEVHMVMRPSYFKFDQTTFGYLSMESDLLEYKKDKVAEEANSGIPGERICDGDDEEVEE